MDKITPTPLINPIRPNIVQSHPLPIVLMSGAATIPPTQEKMFLTKLLTAIPVDAFLDMNSVSIVVAIAKTSIEPTPKKNNAISLFGQILSLI
jgi:hypothetical protein